MAPAPPRDAKWSPPAYQDIRSAQLGLAASADAAALVYVLPGQGTVGEEQAAVRAGNLAVLGAGDFVTVKAAGTRSVVRRHWTSWSSVGSRSVSRWPGPDRS